jgi:hypothetical protein
VELCCLLACVCCSFIWLVKLKVKNSNYAKRHSFYRKKNYLGKTWKEAFDKACEYFTNESEEYDRRVLEREIALIEADTNVYF